MDEREIAERLAAGEGVTAATVTDLDGRLLESAGADDPEATAAATAFLLSCVVRLGDALALGDPLFVVAGSTTNRLGFIQGGARRIALRLSSASGATRACQQARAMLCEH